MKMQTATAEGRHQFTATGSDFVAVNGQIHHASLVVSAGRLLADWPIRDIAELSADAIAAVIDSQDAIVLLGTGACQVFPPFALLRECAQRGIALEVMDSAAACRTYNILAAEGRPVVAAIILSGTAGA